MTLKYAIAVLAMVGGAALVAPAAQAMPNGLPTSGVHTSGVENVRWVCGPHRCWWQPQRHRVYSPYGFYAPRPHHRPHHRHGWRPHRGW
jgi:hypothetical protein